MSMICASTPNEIINARKFLNQLLAQVIRDIPDPVERFLAFDSIFTYPSTIHISRCLCCQQQGAISELLKVADSQLQSEIFEWAGLRMFDDGEAVILNTPGFGIICATSTTFCSGVDRAIQAPPQTQDTAQYFASMQSRNMTVAEAVSAHVDRKRCGPPSGAENGGGVMEDEQVVGDVGQEVGGAAKAQQANITGDMSDPAMKLGREDVMEIMTALEEAEMIRTMTTLGEEDMVETMTTLGEEDMVETKTPLGNEDMMETMTTVEEEDIVEK